jgi:hypothetical protein
LLTSYFLVDIATFATCEPNTEIPEETVVGGPVYVAWFCQL